MTKESEEQNPKKRKTQDAAQSACATPEERLP